ARVVERGGDLVAGRGSGAIHRQLDVEHHRLPDAALPVDEPDDALGGQPVQEDPVAGARVAHAAPTPGSDSSGQRARASMARPSCWPASRRSSPATAIIAALSVENSMRVRQTVVLDIELPVDCTRAATSDEVAATLDYKRVAKRVL